MRTFLALSIIILLESACLAEPLVEHLEPPTLARGKKNRVVFVGSDIDRASGVWTSLSPEKVKSVKVASSTPERSELEIEVTPDCPTGMYGLRLATEDGLSNLQLFAVDELVPLPALKDPHKEFPVAVAGELRAATVDKYRIEVKEGERLAFEVVSSRLGTDADPLLAIVDASGKRVAECDNNPGVFFDCWFEHTFASAGIYTVEVRDARFQGSPHWRYVLRIGAARLPTDLAASWVPLPAANLVSVAEAEPNDLPDEGTPVASLPTLLRGVLAVPGDKDHFALELKKGQRIFVRAETKPLGSAADLELSVLDPTGKEVQRVDDISLPGGALDEGSLTFNVGADGKYKLLVREQSKDGGPEFAYRVEVHPAVPRMHLTADASAFAIPQGSYQTLPLQVTRTDYTGPLLLALVGGPPGLKLEPTIIPEGETSVLCKLHAPANVPLGLHTFGIAAAGQSGETTLSARVAVQPLVDKQLLNVDLIKHALRDNQRWLPTSVVSRLALQITPPSPFTAELAESFLVLPRYQQVALPIQIGRAEGFAGDVTFKAGGGQVGEESQGRRQVFTRYEVATPDKPAGAVTFHSRSQANEAKDRVDVTATGKQGTRSVTLSRSFVLAVQPAFIISLEPAKATLEPGGKLTISLAANRLPAFNGPITVKPNFGPGITLPESIIIPAGQSGLEFELAVAPDYKPKRERIRFVAFGQVGTFQEEPRPTEFDLEVKAPPVAK